MAQKPAWAPRIYTSSGFVKESIVKGVSALDIGCGNRKLPGATGIDSLALPAVDIVHDLDIFPWPVQSGSMDLVFANHYLEHANDVLKTLGEIHRILKPEGRLVVQVPYFRSVDAVTDPTHRHFFTANTLDYVIEGTKLRTYAYTPFSFSKIGFWYGWPHESKRFIARAFKNFMDAHTHVYDQYLSLIAPVECVTWELQKI